MPEMSRLERLTRLWSAHRQTIRRPQTSITPRRPTASRQSLRALPPVNPCLPDTSQPVAPTTGKIRACRKRLPHQAPACIITR